MVHLFRAEPTEINFQRADSKGGENYGWDGFEGSRPYEQPQPQDAVPPVYEYGRSRGASVIGGYVYRGTDIPGLRGAYLFGDYYEPAIRLLVARGGAGFRQLDLGVGVDGLASFGQDADGELYALSLSGPVFRFAPVT